MIRRCPSTTVVSLASAFVLSAGVGLGQQLLGVLEPFRLDLGPEFGDGRLDVQVRVPDVQEGLLRELAHRGAVAFGRRQGDLAPGLGGKAVVPSGHGQARGQPLDVPLERAGQGLVEVVDVEDQPPLRRGERAEIRQVRVPAQLHPQPGGGRAGQVRRHRQRRAPVEGERGHQHPPVPDRHQLRHPRRRLAQQQPDRIPPPARARTRHATPAGPPPWRPCPGPPGPRGSDAPPPRPAPACGQKPPYLAHLISWPLRHDFLAATRSAVAVMATPSGTQRVTPPASAHRG